MTNDDDKAQLDRVSSDFICRYCHTPLFVPESLLSGEYCFTPECPNALPAEFEVQRFDEESQPQLYGEIHQARESLDREISRWDGGELARKLVAGRNLIVKAAIREGRFDLERWNVLGELMLAYNRVSPSGTVTSDSDALRLLDMAIDLHRNTEFSEDTRSGRYVFARSDVMKHENGGFFVLSLKYLRAHSQDLGRQGLVALPPIGEYEQEFPFEKIDQESTDIERQTDPNDLVLRLEKYMPLASQLDIAFKAHTRSARMHKHRRHPVVMSILFGWQFGADPSGISIEQDPELAQKLDIEFQKYSIDEYKSEAFFLEYIDTVDQYPVALRVRDGILLDKAGLLYWNLFLYAQPVPPEYVKTTGYSSAFGAYATNQGKRFEEWLRSELKSLGFSVMTGSQKFRDGPMEHEFDVIAIDHTRRTVMALETVFQNTRSSSLNRFNLVNNELLHRSGLIARADRHARRLQYLSKNMEKLQARLGKKNSISGYSLEGMVVTKTVPIISSVGDMRFVNVFDFLDTLLESS